MDMVIYVILYRYKLSNYFSMTNGVYHIKIKYDRKKACIFVPYIRSRMCKYVYYSLLSVLILSLSGIFTLINFYYEEFFNISLYDSKVYAAINSWTFDTASNYSYDSAQIEVNSSLARLSTDFFNTNWNYRVAIDINNPNSSTLNEYQVEVIMDSSQSNFWSHVQSDGRDVRFLDSDNLTQLSFYFDEFHYSSQFARFWVKLPTLPASSHKTIYLYYGNSAASDARDLIGTFSYSTPRVVGYIVSSDAAAQSLNVISLDNSNQITDGTSTLNLNEQQVGSFPSSELNQNTPISATKLFFANSSGDVTEALHPVSFAGTEFVYYSYRQTNVFHILSPWGDANVQIQDNGAVVWSGVVGSSGSSISRDIVDNHVVRIISDIPILVQHKASLYDSAIFYPASTGPLYGVPSNYFQIGAGPGGSSVSWVTSTGSSGNSSLPANGGYSVNVSASQGSGSAYSVTGTNGIGVNGAADADGGEMVTFLPYKELGTKFGANQIAQYIAVAAPEPNTTCTVTDSLGGIPSNPSGSNPSTGGTNVSVNKLYFGNSSTSVHQWVTPGWKMECDKPVYAYFEKDTNSSSDPNDETMLFSYKQMRQFVYPTPVVSNIATEEMKFSSSSPSITPNNGITYTSLNSFNETLGAGNQGNVTYQISNDGTNWYYWNGTNWGSASLPSNSNNASTVNANISQFVSDVGTGTFYFKAFLNSDGTQAVELDTVTLDYSNNTPPIVDAGSNKNVKDHKSLAPFSDASFSDSDGTVVRAYYNIEGSGYVEIQQGAYPTLLDAVRNFTYTFDNVGNVNCILRVEDNEGSTTDDSLNVLVEQYSITWSILDSFTYSNLDSLNVSDTSGWSNSSLTSPITHSYDYGTYSTTWSRAQYAIGQESNWIADADKTITVYLNQTDGVTINTVLSYDYDSNTDKLSGSCWLERNGTIVTDASLCVVNVLHNGSSVHVFTLTTANAEGKFIFEWIPTGLARGETYNLSAVVSRSSVDYPSTLPYSFSIPISYQYNPNYASTGTMESPYSDLWEQRDDEYMENLEVSSRLKNRLKVVSHSVIGNVEHLMLTGFVEPDSIIVIQDVNGKTIGSTISVNGLWTIDIEGLLHELGTGTHPLKILSLDRDSNILSEDDSLKIEIKGSSLFATMIKYAPLINLIILLALGYFIINYLKRIKNAI